MTFNYILIKYKREESSRSEMQNIVHTDLLLRDL